MHFDTALNCAWLLVGAVSLGSTVGAIYRTRSVKEHTAPWLQLVGIAAVILALFPYISATDDVLRLASAAPQSKQSESGAKTPTADLLRLYEAAEAPLVCQAYRLTVTFVFLCLVADPQTAAVRYSAPLQLGRSPPASSAAA